MAGGGGRIVADGGRGCDPRNFLVPCIAMRVVACESAFSRPGGGSL